MAVAGRPLASSFNASGGTGRPFPDENDTTPVLRSPPAGRLLLGGRPYPRVYPAMKSFRAGSLLGSLLLLELSVSALSWHHGMTESLVMPFPAEKFGHGIMDLGDYAPGDPIPTSFTGVVEAQIQGKTIRHEGHGLANKVFNVPMPTGATFRIGSNSKLFVTVALYQLQEQGLINISESVSSYLDAADFAIYMYLASSTSRSLATAVYM